MSSSKTSLSLYIFGVGALLGLSALACGGDTEQQNNVQNNVQNNTQPAPRQGLGDACEGAAGCTGGLSCITTKPFVEGYCTTTCTSDASCGSTGVCAKPDATSASYCLERCSSGAECREGYACEAAGAGGSACVPLPEEAPTREPTTTDVDSPYAQYGCDFSYHKEYKTDLPADCRCSLNELPQAPTYCACAVPGQAVGLGCEIPGESSGDYPIADGGDNVAKLPNSYVYGSLVDGAEIISAVTWADGTNASLGAIVAMDWSTGKRRIISGATRDPRTGYVERGEGVLLNAVTHVLKGPDGFYYAYGKHFPGSNPLPNSTSQDPGGQAIYRIDPATGDRTLHWFWSTQTPVNRKNVEEDKRYGMCDNGNPRRDANIYCQPEPESFGMMPDGSFLFSCMQVGSGPTGTGEGATIVKVSADAKSCATVTRSGTGSANLLFEQAQGQVGSGYSVTQDNYRGVYYNAADQKIYAYNFISKALIRVDPTTGDRVLVSKAGGAGGAVGAGPGDLGQYWMMWDAKREWLWTIGGNTGPTIVPVYLSDKDRFEEGDRRLTVGCDVAGAEDPSGLVGLEPGLGFKKCIAGPITKANFARGGAWLLPDGDHMIINHSGVYVKIDLNTGNSYNFSM